MYTTQELWQVSLHDPILASVLRGVFPSDKLPVVNEYPSALIANTDPQDQPGTHWLAMNLSRLTKVNSLIGTDFLLRPMTWMNTYFENLTSDVCGDIKVKVKKFVHVIDRYLKSVCL